MPVDLYWKRAEGRVAFGVNDCCMTVADVILAAGGPDLMAGYRGRYSTAAGFVRAYRKRGHETLEQAVAASFAAHGAVAASARDFDVALVGYLDSGARTVAPAFFHGGFWFVRTDGGALVTQAEPETIWRLL